MDNNGAASRYSLILETIDGSKYYYDINMMTFVKMYGNEKIYKGPLEGFDILTCNFDSREQLAQMYGINDQIKKIYLSYQQKGEQLLAPVFNSKEWAYLAKTYADAKAVRREKVVRGKKPKKVEVDFRLYNNSQIFNEIYNELTNLESGFAKHIVSNEERLIRISPDTRNTITNIRAHEGAMHDKMKYTGGLTYIYYDHQAAYKNDLKKCLSNYRELRTLYFNCLQYRARKEQIEQAKKVQNEEQVNVKALKKPVQPPEQLTFLSEIGIK